MNFSVNTGASSAVLHKAILLYRSGTLQSGTDVFASVHDIKNAGTEEEPIMQVMPGAPASVSSVMEAMGGLAKVYSLTTELLPEHVLSFTPHHLVWWKPAVSARVYFDTEELGERSAIVPHPPLLFTVVGDLWTVYALQENKRPTADTKVCLAPYFNVDINGTICRGDAATPESLSANSISQWEEAFFNSAFTHTNSQSRLSTHPDGEYAFWNELLNGKYESFPMHYLKPTDLTITSVLAKIAKRLGGVHG